MESANALCEFEKGRLTVKILGEVDHRSAMSLREEVDKKICYYRPKILSLDLSDVNFMDSSGLGLILGRYALMQEMDGLLEILDPTPRVMKILSLAGAERMLTIKTSR